MSNNFENTTGESDKTENNQAEDPSYLQPIENVWVSDDDGATNISDPIQGVPYSFCITVTNTGEVDSGPFVVKFVLSGDQDPALELYTDELDSLASQSSALAVYDYGAFENKFGVYHVQAVICTPDGTMEISTDNGFDFTINSD